MLHLETTNLENTMTVTSNFTSCLFNRPLAFDFTAVPAGIQLHLVYDWAMITASPMLTQLSEYQKNSWPPKWSWFIQLTDINHQFCYEEREELCVLPTSCTCSWSQLNFYFPLFSHAFLLWYKIITKESLQMPKDLFNYGDSLLRSETKIKFRKNSMV